MKLREIYKKAIEIGIKNDPRGKDMVLKELKRKKKEYKDLKGHEKEFFDKESLDNPYADSRILWGKGEEEVKTALVGIDIEVGEILLADALRRKGKRIDVMIAHHPEGQAYANLFMVMQMQADILNRFGVPISTAESLMEKRISDVEKRLMPVNHTRAVDAARLMDIPLVNFHTPADNMVATYLQKLFDRKKPFTIDEVVDMLLEIPEYRDSSMHGAGPKVVLGSKKRKAGKIFVDMTGGTEGSKQAFQSIAQSGINTVVGMHYSDDHRKEAEKHHLNMVIAGHISSDNLGVNLLLDELSKRSPIKTIDCSGFKRVKRK
jgi:hypothetical protein